MPRFIEIIEENVKIFLGVFFIVLMLLFCVKIYRGEKMKKIISLLILIFVLFSFSFSGNATENTLNWYVVRNKDNKQPLLDSNMQFIEKYGGYYVNKKYPDSARDKVIYLTFDVGYENGNVERILNVLSDEGVSSAFFVLENFIVKNPNLILRMVNEGHLVCNHTASHKSITKFSSREELKAELERLENLYFDLTGLKMQRFFRPPEGKFDQRTLAYLNELGYKTVFWSFAYADWDNNNQPSSNFAKEKIYSNLHNGEIMLLHPTSKTNADILKEVIAELKSRGYRFGTLDEL